MEFKIYKPDDKYNFWFGSNEKEHVSFSSKTKKELLKKIYNYKQNVYNY